MDQIRIDKRAIKEELIAKNLYSLQVDLTRQRGIRIFVMSLLIAALVLTAIYGTLENPIEYTLSNIGNFFEYRLFFIIWAIIAGFAIQVSILALFKLENYQARAKYTFAVLASIFLIVTAFIPALKDIYPFWHWLHTFFAVLHALFMLLSLVPFVLWVSRENPRLRRVLQIWLLVIWFGSIIPLVIFGKSGLFELWFFITFILFLLYLSLMLFEEKIVKMSIAFLKDEPDLNLAIEKFYVRLGTKAKTK